jgi:hypothetical protein
MRKTILSLSLLGSTLIVASMANAAMAAEHITRHHKIYASERVRNAFAAEYPNAFAAENRNVYWPKDQNPFGTANPWRSGIRPDDWRQSVNGGS